MHALGQLSASSAGRQLSRAPHRYRSRIILPGVPAHSCSSSPADMMMGSTLQAGARSAGGVLTCNKISLVHYHHIRAAWPASTRALWGAGAAWRSSSRPAAHPEARSCPNSRHAAPSPETRELGRPRQGKLAGCPTEAWLHARASATARGPPRPWCQLAARAELVPTCPAREFRNPPAPAPHPSFLKHSSVWKLFPWPLPPQMPRMRGTLVEGSKAPASTRKFLAMCSATFSRNLREPLSVCVWAGG